MRVRTSPVSDGRASEAKPGKRAAVHTLDPQFEAVQADTESSFRCLHFLSEDLSTDHTWHYHPEFELTWLIHSQGTRFVGDSIERYSPGDLVLVGPNLPHCWQNDRHAPNHETAELVVVQFWENYLGDLLSRLPESKGIMQLCEDAACGLHFFGPTVQAVGPLLHALVAQKGLDRLLRLLDILNLLSKSTDRRQLAAKDYHLHNDITPVNRHRIEIVHRYVRENLDLEISQAEVAERLGMTASSFSRFFRAATGRNFVDFVNILRVHKACRLLGSNSNASITEIAMECGYRNLSNFNRQFRALKHPRPQRARHRISAPESRVTNGGQKKPTRTKTPR
jgi:AraC-like DNA-binding protein/mannose-6-phosphate isomerase-like protein (cupin superfamily)